MRCGGALLATSANTVLRAACLHANEGAYNAGCTLHWRNGTYTDAKPTLSSNLVQTAALALLEARDTDGTDFSSPLQSNLRDSFTMDPQQQKASHSYACHLTQRCQRTVAACGRFCGQDTAPTTNAARSRSRSDQSSKAWQQALSSAPCCRAARAPQAASAAIRSGAIPAVMGSSRTTPQPPSSEIDGSWSTVRRDAFAQPTCRRRGPHMRRVLASANSPRDSRWPDPHESCQCGAVEAVA